jgi:hypothetical protein
MSDRLTERDRITQLQREIVWLRNVQQPFCRIFWRLEQLIARLEDELERRTT